jgi:thiamine biosynthesis lipoprotein
MKSRSNTEIRRARPLLGTIVDLRCDGSAEEIESGFVAIAKVHRLMSFHNAASDISRINREAFYRNVTVDPWTWRVLKAARHFASESDGTFDVTVAHQLAKWNYLPRQHRSASDGDWRDIVLEENCAVRFRRRVIVDLGGIAKGFAVDRAVKALRRAGVSRGIVNAGGDLRAFGSTSQQVHVRHPLEPARAAGAVTLRERAMATSGIYFARRSYRGMSVSPLLNGRTCRSSRRAISVSVAAADCMTADALTKIVFALGENAAPLLARHRADALLLERDGAPCWMFQSSCARTRSD